MLDNVEMTKAEYFFWSSRHTESITLLWIWIWSICVNWNSRR